MAEAATYEPRLKGEYRSRIRPKLKENRYDEVAKRKHRAVRHGGA